MTDRESAAPAPLVASIGKILFAVDAATGLQRWSHTLDGGVRRLLVADRTLFVASQTRELLWFDLGSGELRGKAYTSGDVDTALLQGGVAYFGGRWGIVAVSDRGHLLWQAEMKQIAEPMVKWTTMVPGQYLLVATDRLGQELWQIPCADPGGGVALALGQLVAQPDFQG